MLCSSPGTAGHLVTPALVTEKHALYLALHSSNLALTSSNHGYFTILSTYSYFCWASICSVFIWSMHDMLVCCSPHETGRLGHEVRRLWVSRWRDWARHQSDVSLIVDDDLQYSSYCVHEARPGQSVGLLNFYVNTTYLVKIIWFNSLLAMSL